MPEKYYLDTAIWIDYYENRKDKYRPLGEWAHKLLSLIEEDGHIIIVSDIIIRELGNHLTNEQIQTILKAYQKNIIQVGLSEAQYREARELAKAHDIPAGDAFHIIISRDNQAILVTRDHHFEGFKDIVEIAKPEEII